MAPYRCTTIRVAGETWVVPRGFGAAYKREAKWQLDQLHPKGKRFPHASKPGKVVARLRSLLALIGYEARLETVANWTLRQRVTLAVYAEREHLSASDNPVRRHPKPRWLPAPYLGKERGEGVFRGPGGTVL